jgi:hypothetical protein
MTRTRTPRFWTGREETILRTVYPECGLQGCLARLPGRSAGAIYQRANHIGLQQPRARPRRAKPQSGITDRLILDVAARTLIRDGQTLVITANKVRLIEAVVRLAGGLGAPRQTVMQAVWPAVDSWCQTTSLKVTLTQLGVLLANHGWDQLIVWDCGPGGRALHNGLLKLAVPIDVRNAGILPLLVPGALRLPLLTLLLAHPDQTAVEALLNKLVI